MQLENFWKHIDKQLIQWYLYLIHVHVLHGSQAVYCWRRICNSG